MKRQLDRLKGKRLVTGDPNLMTKDEICINATPNGVEVKEIGTDGKIKELAGSGESGSSDVEYWKVTDYESLVSNNMINILYMANSIFKVVIKDGSVQISGGIAAAQEITQPNSYVKKLLAFGFVAIAESNIVLTSLVNYFKEYSAVSGIDFMPILDYLTPITKEEFYDLNNV